MPFQVGDVVRWIGKSEDYNSVGLVTGVWVGIISILWSDGDEIDYHLDDFHERAELICK